MKPQFSSIGRILWLQEKNHFKLTLVEASHLWQPHFIILESKPSGQTCLSILIFRFKNIIDIHHCVFLLVSKEEMSLTSWQNSKSYSYFPLGIIFYKWSSRYIEHLAFCCCTLDKKTCSSFPILFKCRVDLNCKFFFFTFFIFPLLPDFSKKYLKWAYLSQCLFIEWIDECILSTAHYLISLWPSSFSRKCSLINLIHTFKLPSQVVSPDSLKGTFFVYSVLFSVHQGGVTFKQSWSHK